MDVLANPTVVIISQQALESNHHIVYAMNLQDGGCQ